MSMVLKEYRPTIAQLRTFVTIAEHGHFGTAAAHLGISQPSLSQALASLETGLGVQLIERSTRKVIITPVGRGLLPYAQAALESLETFVSHARGVHGALVGTLTVGMIPTLAPYVLPGFLRSAPDHLPDLQLQIVEDKTQHIQENLRQGKIDLAVIGTDYAGTGIVGRVLYTEEFVLVVPQNSPLAGRRDLTLEDLTDQDILLLDDGHCLRDQVLDLCRSADLMNDPRQNMTRAASLSTVIQLVAAGMGVTLVPLSAVATECQRPGLALATFDGSNVEAYRTIQMIHRTSSAGVEGYGTLCDLLTESYRQAAAQGRELIGGSLGD